MTRSHAWVWALLALLFCAGRAEAQLGGRDLRLSLDTDLFSIASVHVNPQQRFAPENDYMVYGIGPGQLGGSAVLIPATPLGFGVGFGISSRVLLGLRTGFGLDVIDQDDVDDKRKVLAVSLMPGITFVPLGERAKLFLQASALFQVDRVKQGGDQDRVLVGGFSAGIGTFIFAGPSVSVDLGFFFEGRFGSRQVDVGNADADADVRDLRGLVRLGMSLWK